MQDGSQQRWMTIRVIPAEATSLTVYKLYPDMMYQFMVLSRNQLGDGFFSEIVAIKTKGTHNAAVILMKTKLNKYQVVLIVLTKTVK